MFSTVKQTPRMNIGRSWKTADPAMYMMPTTRIATALISQPVTSWSPSAISLEKAIENTATVAKPPIQLSP